MCRLCSSWEENKTRLSGWCTLPKCPYILKHEHVFVCLDFNQPMFITTEMLLSTSLPVPVGQTYLPTCQPSCLQLFHIICSGLVERSGNPGCLVDCASCIRVTLCWWHNADTLWEWMSKTGLLKVQPKPIFPGHIEDISILWPMSSAFNIVIMYDMNCWMILELIHSRKLSGELSLFVMQYFLLVLAGEVLNRIHDHADSLPWEKGLHLTLQ